MFQPQSCSVFLWIFLELLFLQNTSRWLLPLLVKILEELVNCNQIKTQKEIKDNCMVSLFSNPEVLSNVFTNGRSKNFFGFHRILLGPFLSTWSHFNLRLLNIFCLLGNPWEINTWVEKPVKSLWRSLRIKKVCSSTRNDPISGKKNYLNFYFHTSLWYEDLKGFHKTFCGTTKKCENKNLS